MSAEEVALGGRIAMGNNKGLVERAQRTVRSYASTVHKHHFSSSPLIVVLLLTHFTLGSRSTFAGLRYADVVCLSGIIAAVALLVFRHSFVRAKAQNALVFAMTVSAVLLFMATQCTWEGDWGAVVLTASAAVTGAFIVCVGVFWFEYFVDEAVETAALSLSICLTGACLLTWFLLGMSHSRFVVAYVLLMLLAGVLLCFALRSKRMQSPGFERGVDEDVRAVHQSGAVLMVSLFTLSAAAMFALFSSGSQSWHDDEMWLVLIPAALLISISALFDEKIEQGGLMSLALIFAVMSVLLSAFFQMNHSVLFVIATSGMTITVSLAIIFMLGLSKRSARAPFEMGALLVLAIFSGCILGRYVTELALYADDGGLAKTSLAVVLVVALVICVSVSLGSKSFSDLARRKFREADKRQEEQEEDASRLLKALADEKGLGAREFEVLGLLLEGCSAREVAERMFVASGTAKAHICHVYRKFEVNDREGLLSAVSARLPNLAFGKKPRIQ